MRLLWRSVCAPSLVGECPHKGTAVMVPLLFPLLCSPASYHPTRPGPNTCSFCRLLSGCLTSSYRWARSGQGLCWLLLGLCGTLNFSQSGVKLSIVQIRKAHFEDFFFQLCFTLSFTKLCVCLCVGGLSNIHEEELLWDSGH